MFDATPRVGDHVKTTEQVAVTITDAMLNRGLPAGTRGVIVDVSGGWISPHVVVRLDGGLFGSPTVRLRPRQVKVTRRGAGLQAYERSAGRRAAVRWGAILAVFGPIAWFCLSYLLRGGRPDGLVVALVESAISSAMELVSYALSSPVSAMAYCLVGWAAWRLATR